MTQFVLVLLKQRFDSLVGTLQDFLDFSVQDVRVIRTDSDAISFDNQADRLHHAEFLDVAVSQF